MRDLSIKRNKSFVGCLAKLKVYIEDIDSKDIVINGVPCRKLGELKNGEMKTFQIGEESAKVFVIAFLMMSSSLNVMSHSVNCSISILSSIISFTALSTFS